MNQITCQKCGQSNRTGAKFCAHCREPMAVLPPSLPGSLSPPGVPAGQFPPAPVVATPAKRNARLWAAIGVVLLLIIAVLAIIFWPSDGDDTAVSTVTPTTEIATMLDETETPTISPPIEPDPTATVIEGAPTTAATTAAETPVPEPTAIVNLLSNGSFEQNWDIDWQRTLGPNASGSQRTEVIDVGRGKTGRGLHIERTGPDHLYLEQTVIVNPANLHFTAELKLVGSIDEAANTEGIGTLMLVYQDIAQTPLGYSMWINGNQHNSPLFGVGLLPPIGNNVSRRWLGDEWQRIDIDLRQEIINSLPTVNPDAVHTITVILLAMGSDSCSPDSCPVDIKAADLLLSSE